MNLQQKLYLRVVFGISKKPEITPPIKYSLHVFQWEVFCRQNDLIQKLLNLILSF